MYRKDDTPHIMHTFRCRREYVNVVQYNVDGDIYDRGGLDHISLFIDQLSFLMVVVTNNYIITKLLPNQFLKLIILWPEQ